MMRNVESIEVVLAEFWQAFKLCACRNFFGLFMFSRLSINFDDILQLRFCTIIVENLSDSTQSLDTIDTQRSVIFIIL